LLPRNLRTDRALPSCTFSHLSARDIYQAKNTYFPYRGLGGGATVPCYTFLESSCLANVTPHLTRCDLPFSSYSRSKFGILGIPPRRDFVSGTDMYHRAKFHADRCHRRRDLCHRTHRKIENITADLISNKSRASVAFVDNQCCRILRMKKNVFCLQAVSQLLTYIQDMKSFFAVSTSLICRHSAPSATQRRVSKLQSSTCHTYTAIGETCSRKIFKGFGNHMTNERAL